ncbi:hypothetical protein BC749_102463 [Flavobacterium araucananum]|uniref:DUF490 domain-containing protein n=1 Tax=Flavobacterium araucananum TaxID=946678 RepID=A0A227P9F2_9FLAO|nr:hypothetical protein [Flavobacterium araucananum]OXG06551.1 hypothetical protein B0A64_10605 [Flavobacterium araucananum]PWK00896.1 hypothetical protein BC749_102463 [Flavobacterium araucananum]
MKKITPKFPSFLFSSVLFLISFNSFSSTYRDTISNGKKNNPILNIGSQKGLGAFSYDPKSDENQFTESYIKKNFPVADPTNKNLNKALELFKAIDLNNNIIDFLEPKNLASLPIGIKKTVNGIQYMLGISNAKFTPEYTELTAFVRIILPQIDAAGKQEQLFFGANNIKLSHKGGLIGDTNLVLLGDVPLKILGNQALLVLKGGMDMATGKIENKTYVKIDCSGFKELGITADVQFSQKIIKPVDADNNVIPDKSVIGTFQTSASNWNDILIELSLPKFQISTFNGLIFEIKKAKIDLSDIRNPDKINWPPNYQTDYLVPGNELLWRGLYASAVDITLPEEFQIAGSSKRISFSAKDLLIDGMGVSGTFTGNNILDLGEGSASGWSFSVNSINLGFKANALVSGGFGGAIVLPMSNPEKRCKEGAGSELAYTASINPIDHEYLLRADVNKDLCFNVFKATANIEKGSYIELKVKNGKFLPRALLNGNLTIAVGLSETSEADTEKVKDPKAPVTTYMYENGASSGALYDIKNVTTDPKETSKTETDDTKKTVLFDGIIFQNLQLQTVTPIIKADYFGYKNNFDEGPKSSKVANFPITIHEIALIADDNSAALRVDLSINLMENQFNGRTKFDLVGRFNEKTGIKKWKFDYVKFQRIDLAADIGGAKFEGSITIMDNDPVYGKGFKGNLKAEFKGGIIVEANAIFGKMTTFRYWYVDAMVDGLNIPCSAFVIKGFGGGAYYNMKKQGFSSTFTASGVQYVPDEASSLGIKAMIHFANAASPNAFWGGAGFEIAFNDHGGINRISIYGEGHVMQEFGFKAPLSSLKKDLQQVSLKESTYPKETLDSLKESNLIEASKEVYPDRVSGQAGLNAYAAIEYDFTTKTLHGSFDLYVDVAGGIIKGISSKNRAGWAVLHFAPDKWYIHMGTPTDRLGLKMAIGSVEVEAGGYFMIGDDIPGSPPPPDIVAQILGLDVQSLNYMRDENSVASGKGFAFGSNFSIKTGDLTFLIFYANFQAGFGFDIMVKDYGEAQCKGSGQIGIDGWYANGQSYAYLQGELGIKIKLFMIKKKITIIKGGGAVLLQAKLPNPVWIRGYLGGYFNLLGGAVKGSFRFKLEFGKQCEFVNDTPLGGLKTIADITPADGTKDASVFTLPQVGFNMPIEKNFTIEDDNGVKTYKLKLEEYTIKKEGTPIVGEISWNENKDLVSFTSHDILPPNSNITLTVKVSFLEYVNGNWKTVYDDGQIAIETETRNFTTGVAPNNIPVNNIAYCYPVFDQKYVYQNESKQAYIVLKQGQPYLFDLKSGQSQKAFYTTGDKTATAGLSYDSTLRKVNVDLPVLQTLKPYNLVLMTLETKSDANANLTENFEKQDLGLDAKLEVKSNKLSETVTGGQGIELLQYNFNTSQYNSFQEKMIAKKARRIHTEIIDADLHALNAENVSTEPFDEIEIIGNAKTMNIPLVNVEAILDDNYFKNDIYPLIYKGYPLEADLTLNRDTRILGNPPNKGVELVASYQSDLTNNPKSAYLRERLPYRYNQPFYYKQDFIKIQYKVVNKYLNSQNQSMIDKYRYIINGVFPMIKDGAYNIKINYTLPGGQAGTSSIFTFNKTN